MRRAPGPGLRVITQLAALRRDPLRFMQQCHARYGDIVRLGAGPATVHLIGSPSGADQVLRENHQRFDRRTRSAAAMRLVTGESILTESGDEWKARRLTLQPAFTSSAVEPLASMVAAETARALDEWLSRGGDGTAIDVGEAVTRLTLAIASRAFFGTDLRAETDEIAELIPPIIERTYERSTSLFPLHRIMRTARDRQFDARIASLQRVVGSILRNRLSPRGDALGRLTNAERRGLGAGGAGSDVLALLLAGHETTANTLAWAFYYLGTHPDVLRRAREELDRESAGGFSPATLPRLPYLSAVISETMRLAPVIWIIERRAKEETEIDGWAIPADSIVYVSPWIVHRHPEFWSDAEQFTPERFMGLSGKHPAYIPFGGGPHHCLGVHFALLEAKIILAMVLERFDFDLATDVVPPQAWITLRPSVPIVAKLRPR